MNRYKAVIIDDEMWTRQVIRSLGDWEACGIEIAGEASDGEYGLELVRQVRPDIILTDVCMPHMSGLELVERLKEKNDRVQVICISGFDDYSYVRAAMKLDVADYLLKPVKAEELNRQLRSCIRKLEQWEEEKTGELFNADFLKADWSEEYERHREALAESMNSGDVHLLEEKLERMKAFLIFRLGDEPDKGRMIGIYYSLLPILQRFISSRDFQTAEIFGEEDTTFVFSRESTPATMIQFLERLFLTAFRTVQERMKNRGRLDIMQVKRFMEEHFGYGVTLEQTAAEFYVSREYLSKAFKAAEGKGFSGYLTSLRMEKAKELITDYRVPIKEVSMMVGYVDHAHFYKTFKKYFGVTPGEMRQV